MNTEQTLILAITLGVCLIGGTAILLRIALERHRLVGRYAHIKIVMEYEEKLKAHQKNAKDSVAHEEGFVAQEAAEPADVGVE